MRALLDGNTIKQAAYKHQELFVVLEVGKISVKALGGSLPGQSFDTSHYCNLMIEVAKELPGTSFMSKCANYC